MDQDIGIEMYNWAKELFPLNRSITGDGTRETLHFLKKIIPEMELFEVPSGTQVFDWTVPDEWNVRDAWVKDEKGNKVIDFSKNNLHLLGYSSPIKTTMSLDELQKRLFTLPEMPDAIPYVTSYYKKSWGFCLSENDRKKLLPGNYEIYIDSTLAPGSLSYGEIILPGIEKKEILISTYVCHPSMANNELSGPVVAAAITKWLKELKNRRFTYRIVFVPETIGAIVYLDQNYKHLKEAVKAGFVLSCIGDDNSYSMLESPYANTLADQVAKHVLKHHDPKYKTYPFTERGSDERQYCAPGIDLPVCSLMRTKYGEYPEYHTSLDDLDYISPKGLRGGYDVVKKCLTLLEKMNTYRVKVLGEPQLGKRGLYPPNLVDKSLVLEARKIINFIAYCNGTKNLIEVADIINVSAFDLIEIADKLLKENLLEIV